MTEHKKEILALIPARGGSKSIPRKNIKHLGGYPLIAYSIAAGLQAKHVDRVVVTTDDDEIAEIASHYGAEVPFMRPKALGEDYITDLPVFLHALKWFDDNESWSPDAVVHLRPTSPFRPRNCIDEAVECILKDDQADSVRGVTPSGENPFKMWQLQNGAMKPLIRTQDKESYNMPRQQLPSTYWHSGHIDIITYKTITEKKSMSGDRILPYLIDPQYAVDLDTPVDWRYAEYLIQQKPDLVIKPLNGNQPKFSDIQLLVLDFDGVFTDNRVYINEKGIETVQCNRADGMGIDLLKKKNITVIVLSTEENPVVTARCKKFGIPCLQGIKDKGKAMDEIIQQYDIDPKYIGFVGNDFNDLPALRKVGFPVAVADAYPEVLKQVSWILSKKGGRGAIREMCDLILNQKK